MKGDFTREPFDPLYNFSRVLMQQGRVQLDADFNEQSAILLHLLRALVVDLVGPYGVPGGGDDFLVVKKNERDFAVAAGHYYVDGILVENHDENTGFRLPESNESYFAYLDVWERHITHVQYPHIREIALGMSGPDTCTRAQVTWQVRFKTLDMIVDDYGDGCDGARRWLNGERAAQEPANRPTMRASARKDARDTSACSIPPESSYRRKENQLYRIEVHRGGAAWDGETDKYGAPIGNADMAATFKWSRDNGSLVFAIARQQGAVVYLEHLGRGPGLGLDLDDWVEIMDDDRELAGEPGILAQVKSIDTVAQSVTLEAPQDAEVDWPEYDEKTGVHPLLRRWDQRKIAGQAMQGGAVLLAEGEPLEIEDGIQVAFSSGQTGYRTGDYWLIPARMATGDIEWRQDGDGTASAEPPVGIRHHYAPLALIIPDEDPTNCRCWFERLWRCEPAA